MYDRDQVAALYAEAKTTRALAAELGISKSAAHELLKRLDIPRLPRGRKKPRPTCEQVYDLIVTQRWTMTRASEFFGFSVPILMQVMADYGIEHPRWVRVRPDPDELRRLYIDAGLTIREIAARLGYTFDLVRKDMLKHRIPLRPHAFQPLALPVTRELEGCWEWQGSRNRAGYGQINRNGSNRAAHRWVYARMRGPIPEGLVLDHLCYNPPCVNPDHLEPVTQAENLRRSHERRRRLRRQHAVRNSGHPAAVRGWAA